MAVHYFGGSDGDPEGWYAAMGFAAPFVGAGGLAIIGARLERPCLCVAGGVALAVMSVVSFVMLPLLVAAGFMFAAIRNPRAARGSCWIPAALAVGLVASFALIVFHQDPASWSTATGGGSSSNIVTATEASIGLAVTIAVLVSAMAWSRSQRA